MDVEDPSGSEISTPSEAENDNSEEYTFEIGAQRPQTAKPIFQSVCIMDTPINIMADSGTTVNILSKRDFVSLKLKPQLTDTNVKEYPYISTQPLDLCGKLRANVVSDHCSSEEIFYVAEGSSGSKPSWMTSKKLNLIKAVSTVEHPPGDLPPGTPDSLKDFPSLLNGMGEY